MLDALIGTTYGLEHGTTLASSVVAGGVRVDGTMTGSEHGSTLTSSVVAGDVAWRGDVWF